MRVRVLCFLLLASFAAQGQHQFRVLHAFGNGNDGAGVYDSVTLDTNGNVYGTASGGGVHKAGIAFRLNPGSGGHWREAVLHVFGSRQHDGEGPLGGLILDPAGNLFGTTQLGGTYDAGTVFELALGMHGWTEIVLYNFTDHDLACCPWGNLVWDTSGNLYGTGDSAFELSPRSERWKETILHNFTGKNGDGLAPYAGPIRDAAGNLYGTTMHGGGGGCGAGCGTAWELSPPSSETQGWTEHILHAFGVGDDLAFPGLGQLAMDQHGNLYGTTVTSNEWGAVYKLTRVSGGPGQTEIWQESIPYNFTGGSDGALPEGVILDKSGNLYGTTGSGGAYGEGVVFKLSPQADGKWNYTLLHTFNGQDGAAPVGNLTFGPDGKLYGTTSIGGTYGGGVVFQLTP
jgi:uncharacterized repeat protein (TIGR03803 family)